MLSLFLLYGVVWLGLPVTLPFAATVAGTAFLTQALCFRLFSLPAAARDYRSALITCLSLCLLLRTPDLWVAALAASVAIGSKFTLRLQGKHLFNPANIGIVTALLLHGNAWVSPGQWGSGPVLALFLAGLGLAVLHRAARIDVALAFLASFAAILFGRALWLGDPLTIPFHQMQNGALLIFAFFMLSDPKTIPNARPTRLFYAALVAAVGAWLKLDLYVQDGLFYALPLCSLCVPLLDRALPAAAYRWRRNAPREGLTNA